MSSHLTTYQSNVKSTTTRVSPACLSSHSNSSSLVMVRIPPFDSGSWGRLPFSTLPFCSSFALSFPSFCFSFPAGDREEGGGGEEDTIPLSGEEVPVASESSLGKRLWRECVLEGWCGGWECVTASIYTLLLFPTSSPPPHSFTGDKDKTSCT